MLTKAPECLNGARLEGLRGAENQMNHGWVPYLWRAGEGFRQRLMRQQMAVNGNSGNSGNSGSGGSSDLDGQ